MHLTLDNGNSYFSYPPQEEETHNYSSHPQEDEYTCIMVSKRRGQEEMFLQVK